VTAQPAASALPGDVTEASVSSVSTEAASPIVQIADALDQLSARVERDCNVDAAEGTPPSDPAWAEVVEELAMYAERCRAVLETPIVAAALAEDPAW